MNISSTRLAARPQVQWPASRKEPSTNGTSVAQESFNFSHSAQNSNSGAVLKTLAGVAAGTGVGLFAGLNSGNFAGVGGALVSVLPGAFAGGVCGALVGEKIGSSDPSRTVGGGLWGALIGGSLASSGGAMVASQMSGLGSAVGLGLLGATSGLLLSAGE